MREFIGAFSTFINIQNALVAEFYEVIYTLEEAQKFECDFTLVCVAFTARTNVHWMLRNR